MIINRYMQDFELQQKTVTISQLTHARKEDWSKVRTVKIAVYDINSTITNNIYIDTVKYKNCKYMGLTRDKSIKETDRLVKDGIKYTIVDTKNAGRFNMLIIKGADTNVG